MKKIKKILLILFTGIMLIIPALPAHAALIPDCAKTGDGGICCALLMTSNFARLILGVVGSLALLMLIIGGFMWITSRGNMEQVEKGRKLISQTIIGILIVVFAWVGVNFIINSIAGTEKVITLDGADTAWYEICKNYKACENMGSGWECRDVRSCGDKFKDYTQCDSAENCVRGLCPGGNNNVCCNPNIKSGLK